MLNKKVSKIIGNTNLMLFLIVLFGLILRLAFFSGIGTSDDLAYSGFANSIDEGFDQDASGTLSTRLGIIYITSFAHNLFGINDFSSVLFILITSIGNIILIFYFGKLLFNKKIGLMAAFLLSFFPLEIVYATKLFTDIPSAFFMALGVYIFLYSEIKAKGKHLNYLLSGLFIGIGYFIRESALLIALFFIIYIAYKKKIKKEYFLVPLGILVIFAFQAIIFLILTGNPIYGISASQQHNIDAVIAHNYWGRLDFPTGLFHYPHLILTNNLISYFYIFMGIALIYFIIKKRKETYSMMIWFLALLLYLSFGSESFSQYIPFRAVDRYLSIITIPGILFMALLLTEKKKFIKEILMPLTLVLLLLSSLISVYVREDRNVLDNLRDLYPYLERLEKPIYIDGRSILALDYISKYQNKLDIRAYPSTLTNIKDSYIVINPDMIRKLKEANRKRVFPKEVDQIPDRWKLIKEIRKDGNKIILYYIP